MIFNDLNLKSNDAKFILVYPYNQFIISCLLHPVYRINRNILF